MRTGGELSAIARRVPGADHSTVRDRLDFGSGGSLDDIRAAAPTDLRRGRADSLRAQPHAVAVTGAQVFLKFENLSSPPRSRSAARDKLLSLSEAERRRGVIAMSAGNHAQAVAYHAARLGIPAMIVMPKGSPNTKIKNTQVHGATWCSKARTCSNPRKHARTLAARDKLVFVHPYEDPLIIAGQGTVGVEMLTAAPDLEMWWFP